MTKLGRGELIIALLLGSFPPMRKGLLWCHWISYYNVSIATDIFDLLTAICKRTRTKVALRNMLFLTQMELLSHGWQERRHLLVFGRFVPLHHNFHMGRSTLSAGFVCSETPPSKENTPPPYRRWWNDTSECKVVHSNPKLCNFSKFSVFIMTDHPKDKKTWYLTDAFLCVCCVLACFM